MTNTLAEVLTQTMLLFIVKVYKFWGKLGKIYAKAVKSSRAVLKHVNKCCRTISHGNINCLPNEG